MYENVNEYEYELSKKIDKYYIVELVKKINNDAELGKKLRNYIMFLESSEK